MPQHNRPFDNLPAFGLREDARDDFLRRYSQPLTPEQHKSVREALKAERALARAESNDEEDDDDERELGAIRRAEKYPKDPADWLIKPRMTQTEVSLRLAKYLITRKLVSSKVALTCAGYELTRRDMPRFPIHRFLTENLGLTARQNIGDKCRGSYIMKDRPQSLVIDFDRLNGHLITHLGSGQRLVVFASAGRVASSRSPAEHKQLRGAIGRALTWEGADALDLLAVCVPRSSQYLRLSMTFREAEGLKRARLIILTVDRHSGEVHGLPEFTESPK